MCSQQGGAISPENTADVVGHRRQHATSPGTRPRHDSPDRAGNRTAHSPHADEDQEHDSPREVAVDLPFMATISRIGSFIEQRRVEVDREPDDHDEYRGADRVTIDDESATSFTDKTRAFKLGVAVKRSAKLQQVSGAEIPTIENTPSGGVRGMQRSFSLDDVSTEKYEKLGAGGRGNWPKIRTVVPALSTLASQEEEAGGLLAWMKDIRPRSVLQGHASSLPGSPMRSLESPGMIHPDRLASSASSSVTFGHLARGVQSMPASPLPMHGGTPLSAASTHVEADSSADSPNVKSSLTASLNFRLAQGSENKSGMFVVSKGRPWKGSYLSSYGRPKTATGVVGIFVSRCVCVCARVLVLKRSRPKNYA